jgi:hypothetical protein
MLRTIHVALLLVEFGGLNSAHLPWTFLIFELAFGNSERFPCFVLVHHSKSAIDAGTVCSDFDICREHIMTVRSVSMFSFTSESVLMNYLRTLVYVCFP